MELILKSNWYCHTRIHTPCFSQQEHRNNSFRISAIRNLCLSCGSAYPYACWFLATATFCANRRLALGHKSMPPRMVSLNSFRLTILLFERSKFSKTFSRIGKPICLNAVAITPPIKSAEDHIRASNHDSDSIRHSLPQIL